MAGDMENVGEDLLMMNIPREGNADQLNKSTKLTLSSKKQYDNHTQKDLLETIDTSKRSTSKRWKYSDFTVIFHMPHNKYELYKLNLNGNILSRLPNFLI